MAKEMIAGKPLRILMMIHRLADNSPYCFYVHEQAKALRARGHEVVVISCMGVLPLMDRLRPDTMEVIRRTPKEAVVDGIPVYYPRALSFGNAGEKVMGGLNLAVAALPVARRLHKEKPFDIVHAHMLPRDGHCGLIVSRALGIPVALTVHGTDIFGYFKPGETPWRRNRMIAREVDALMAVSSLLLSRVEPYRGAGKLTRVVPNGVDLSLVPEKTENTRGHIISVGTLKKRKCMDTTIEAFARLAAEYPESTLTIVGIGEMEAELRAQIGRYGLQERVRLTGGLPHDEVLRLMAKSDLFVLPSWGEGYGIVYIEAMAAGCVAIGAKNEGIADTIVDGENGFLVTAGDAAQTEAAMRRVLGDASGCAALREAGREAARRLTWARNAQTVEGIYREAIAAYQKK